MYKRNSQGWLKHLDFFILDLASLQIAYILGTWIRMHMWAYSSTTYRNLGIILMLIDALVIVLVNTMHNVMKRSNTEEFILTLRHSIIVLALAATYMFALQAGEDYSRIVLFITCLLHIAIGYIIRILWKNYVKQNGVPLGKRGTMLAVLKSESAEEMMQRLQSNHAEGYVVVGIVLDKADKTEICGIPVVTTLDQAARYISQKWIDSVYIDCPSTDPLISKLMEACHEMAIPVHYHVAAIGRNNVKQFVEKIGGTTVITTSINYASPLQLFIKRCMDIIGGLVGSVFALLIMAVVGPMIKSKSPGPIIFKQTRIGQNGKQFQIYKLRSMYMDAEERKKELMKNNRIADGMMFKMEFDPRIIGNEILPDGTKKTGIGEFIRKTSLDEFPQFFNVLRGQMSLVGTRPPTLDEWEKYEYHHRARLACKPGITGMWQVSGRSEITDFEEVVKLDTEYITNWSFGLDAKILFKTIGIVLTGRGAM